MAIILVYEWQGQYKILKFCFLDLDTSPKK